MTRKEKAIELHDKGFNCAQAVACAFAEETGIPEETSHTHQTSLPLPGSASHPFHKEPAETPSETW